MSRFEAPLVKIELHKHPNADKLSIVPVGGYQCVVNTKDFENEKVAVYIPVDSIAAPDHPLLAFLEGKKVSTCKLRGAISEGLLLPGSKVLDFAKNNLKMSDSSIEKVFVEGKDFSGILRIKKYEAYRASGNGEDATLNISFAKYTDIEPIQKFEKVFQENELVHVSEKIHGTSFRAGYIDGKFCLGSRNRQIKIYDYTEETVTKLDVWNKIYRDLSLQNKLLQLSELLETKTVAIYGEVAGPGIQDLNYGLTSPSLFVYDLWANHKFIDPIECNELCVKLQLVQVPCFGIYPYTSDLIQKFVSGRSLLAEHIREGIVLKPLVPRIDWNLGRVILKVVSEQYKIRQNPIDYTE